MNSSTQYPRISIVTPNYNKKDFLERTILSVLSQGYPNLEYIVIDGGSTDGSVEIIKKYEKDLAYWVSEPDNGMYQAIKKGFEHTTGEIMAWINSDDMYHPNALFTVAQIFSDLPNVSWLVGAQTHYDEKSRTVKAAPSIYFNHRSFLMGFYRWIQQETTFWRRSLYDKAGGVKTDYRLAGDFDLWVRFSRHEKLFITDALIGGFRHSKDQLSHQMEKYCGEVDDIIAKELKRCEDSERSAIKKIKFYQRCVQLVRRTRIFNWRGLESILFNEWLKEQKSHHLIYNYTKEMFEPLLIVD